MNDTTKNTRTAEQLAALADTLERQAAAPLEEAAAALHLAWQVLTLNPDSGDNALARFRSNRFAGLLMALACWVVGNAGLV